MPRLSITRRGKSSDHSGKTGDHSGKSKMDETEDGHNSNDEYVISLNPFSGNSDAITPPVTPPILSAYPTWFTQRIERGPPQLPVNEKAEDPLLYYLLFSHILANDVKSASLLLQNVTTLSYSRISYAIIEQIEQSHSHGILQQEKYRKLFAEVKHKSAQIEPKLSSQQCEGYLPINSQVDLLVLASLLKHKYDSTEMLELIMEYFTNVSEKTFHALLCHPAIDLEVVSLLVTDAHIFYNNTTNPESKTKLFVRLLQALSSFYVTSQGRYERHMTKSKIMTILDMCYPSDDETSQYCEGIKECLKISVIDKDSSLFLLFAQHNTYTRMWRRGEVGIHMQELLLLATQTRAYYIVHLICNCTDLKPKLQESSEEYLEAASSDLYLTHYLLKNGFDIRIRMLNSFSLFKSKNIVSMWLTCAYCQNGMYTPDFGWLCKAIAMGASPHLTVIACKLLIKLGASVNETITFVSGFAPASPLVLAIKKNNLRLVRLLLFHNCDLTIRHSDFRFMEPCCIAQYTLDKERYNIVKVLLLCGAEKPPFSPTDAPLRPRFDNKYEEDRQFIMDTQQKPQSLQYFCRKTVRKAAGSNLADFLKSQNYPKSLKDYIRTKYM